MSYLYLIESDKYVYTAYNVLKSTKRSERFYRDEVCNIEKDNLTLDDLDYL